MSDTEVVAVERDASGVTVTDAGGRARRFDRVVIATHPDQALRLLADPTPSEQRVLSSFDYASNETVLHTDGSLLPQASGARASWNYLLEACTTTTPMVGVTYHLNRLQALDEPAQYCVTLNQTGRIAPGSEISRMVYEHPSTRSTRSRHNAGCRRSPACTTPPSAARTTAGASTRTAACRACARRWRWGALGDRHRPL